MLRLLATIIFLSGIVLSVFAIISSYLSHRRHNQTWSPIWIIVQVVILHLNVGCLQMASRHIPALEQVFGWLPVGLVALVWFYGYKNLVFHIFAATGFFGIRLLCASNLQILFIFIYCFMLPILLSYNTDSNANDKQMVNAPETPGCGSSSVTIVQIVAMVKKVITRIIPSPSFLTYLSLLLPATYFCYGWFLYTGKVLIDDIYDISIETHVLVKVMTLTTVLLSFSVLAVRTIGAGFFCVKIEGSAICKFGILFLLYLVLTLAISTMMIVIVHIRYPLSLDQHEWIVTSTGLSVRDQAILEEIKQVELDMTICDSRSDGAIENLTRLIDKYERKYLEESSNEKKPVTPLGRLYLSRGLLFYHHSSYDKANNDLEEALIYNPSSTRTKLYIISTLIMLGKYGESVLYIRKCFDESRNRKTRELFDKYLYITLKSEKNSKARKDVKFMVDVPPPLLFDNLWPTHHQLVELSGVAYCTKRLSSHWQIIGQYDDKQDTGYYGIAVQNIQTMEIVIAHRGTVLDFDATSLIADYDLFLGVPPKLLDAARNFTETIRKQVKQNRILWHTGHSLGGAIAEFLVANDTLFEDSNKNSLSFAVTFDSPGIMELLEDYHHDLSLQTAVPRSTAFHVISYLSASNIVNTMGTHIGLVIALSPYEPVFQTSHPILRAIYSLMERYMGNKLDKFKAILDLVANHSREQLFRHSLQTIIDCFKLWPNESGLPFMLKRVIKWPRGQQQLIRYIDSSFRKPYNQNDTGFERRVFEVVEIDDHGRSTLPLELWNSKTQTFLKQLRTNREVTKQLGSNCQLMKSIGVHETEIMFDILHKSYQLIERDNAQNRNFVFQMIETHLTHRKPVQTNISIDDNVIPSYGEKDYKFNILTLYTILSVFDLDKCL
jgi:tetratricopeptide (TPR) repeat protein